MLQQLTILGVLMLTSKGSAGVAGSGFVTLAATLAAMHSIPVAGLVLLLGVDRFMAEARAVTNTIGNAIGAVVVAAWDGCLDREKLALALDGHIVLTEDEDTVEDRSVLAQLAAPIS